MNKSITKITAPNGGVFTGQGTNTYLIGQEDITLVDPGPNIKKHIKAILKRGAGKIKRILVTHTHTDHSPAALPISKELKPLASINQSGCFGKPGLSLLPSP